MRRIVHRDSDTWPDRPEPTAHPAGAGPGPAGRSRLGSRWRAAVLALAVAALSAVTGLVPSAAQAQPGHSPPGPPAQPAAAPLIVRIGHAGPTRGWLARVGLENQNAARLAVEALNRAGRVADTPAGPRPLQFALVTADDAGEPVQAEEAAHRLVGAGVSAVVGHMLTGHTLAAAPIYARAGIAQLTPSATGVAFTRSGWPTAFRLLADDARIGSLLGREVAQAWPGARVAVVEDGSAYARGLAEAFIAALQPRPLAPVSRLRYTSLPVHWDPIIAGLQVLQPAVLLFAGMDREAGQLMRRLRAAGLAPLFVGGDSVCTLDLVSYWAVGDAEDGQVLCALPAGLQADGSPLAAVFVTDYAARFGVPPEFYGAHVHDAVMLIADAVQRAGSAEPAAVRAALAATPGLDGITGRLAFDPQGQVRAPAVTLFTYRNEARVPLRTVR